MCRMVGMVASPVAGSEGAAGVDETPAAFSLLPSWEHLVGASHSLRVQASSGCVPPGNEPGHGDSWGVGWFDAEGQVSLLRQTGSAADSAYFVFAAEAASRGGGGSGPGRTVIGHLRKASCGVISSENAHPIQVTLAGDTKDTLLVAHNGTLREPLRESLRVDIAGTGRGEARSDSDTVVLAGWLAASVERAGNVSLLDSLAGALRELFHRAERMTDGDAKKAYSAVNLMIAHRTGLYALRQFSNNPDYYTMYMRPLKSEADGAEGWVVASEVTDSAEGWAVLTPGQLTFFPTTGQSDASVAARDVV